MWDVGVSESEQSVFQKRTVCPVKPVILGFLMNRFKRTRIAPTPSGYLHLGNVLSFALTAALAKQTGAHVLLRIDDLDQARVKQNYIDDIFETLEFLKLPWDEGPRTYADYKNTYSQIHRMQLYEDALQQLRQQGHLFACECSRSVLFARHPDGVYMGTCRDKGLSLDNPGYNWRIDTSGATLPPNMQYFVVRKRDGFPAYQLASVVDDVQSGVDLIVRGEDLRESTQAQIYLAGLLGYDSFVSATFYHHVLLKGARGEKLSKSSGATSIQYLRKQGQTAEDIYQKVGQLIGISEVVSDWEQFGVNWRRYL
ncbi:glutamyl-tRNA synthetase [Parapedobacter indicus]|uniref:Glutamyl-tRNA synthetase n=2 Tax=Parapedobacter indicus TaxID=1477437 RepID=A0A1I3LSR8_9SPHI|nr:glutamyl-tRNA synthetase [Parapedobacter indicus]SFI87737.1 glutamyl-tRNA synthetase [Parapedobacter indicus]